MRPREHRIGGLALCLALLVALPGGLAAQEADAEETSGDQAAETESLEWGVGFQSSFPAYGFSVMYDWTDKITAQGVIGPLGTLNTFAARGLYRFERREHHDFYAYGMVGGWSYSTLGVSETVPGIGAGAGIEGDLRGLFEDEDFPPIFLNAELGLGIVNFDQVAYDFSTFMFGVGAHYRF